jgi:hypothetical protein
MTLPYNSPGFGVSSDAGRWRTARRLLLVLGAAATFIALFYTVENWRGRRAWDNRRHELEARGEVLDWTAYIPAPVPDEQNFFKAPKMQEWFVKPPAWVYPQSENTTNEVSPFSTSPSREVDLVLAEVRVVTRTAALNSTGTEVVLRFGNPASQERVASLLEQTVGPYLIAARDNGVLLTGALDQSKPPQWVLQADSVPNTKELEAFFPTQLRAKSQQDSAESLPLGVEAAGGDIFRVVLKRPKYGGRVYGAADYLALTESLKPKFDLVRQALQRPYARIDCDYERPFAIGIPNFINLRQASQMLSQRAQCHLLVGQPEDALRELTLVHDLSQIVLAKPSGKPITLVGAMIYVAIHGLYAQIISDGLDLHAWREPQLQALEQQLEENNLLMPVVEAFREERAATSRTFEATKRSELINLFAFEGLTKLSLRWMPRGWFYQNMAAGAEMEQLAIGTLDPTNQLVHPRPVTEVVSDLASEREQHSPYHFLVAVALPNFAKALQTAAANQTLLNQARLSCALERFRLAKGNYPDSLDALTPGFVEKLPHDLIGGQQLKYRLNQDGGYLLYSIGWDEKDGGGVPGKSREEGDWVWSIR